EPLEKNVDFSGNSSLEVILDGEAVHLIMESSKKTILESLEAKGIDAPYSCRGGVCCSCKAKVLEGSVRMKVNYSLTDEEVAAGYVLTCQALPNASNIKLSFDE
ncbi:MAG: 2Fe-2S iron-sulfur cluster binding domain-containing protein, partial [Bacteroidetes bacterium]|nr:2Fe-2S iron-sulfur cluster binding domain-containing protein [Bacteroidota bacterium]